MKAIKVRTTGDPETLELRELHDSVPNKEEVLVPVSISGVNFADVFYREGIYKASLPLIPGLDGAAMWKLAEKA
jgi:NADPH2:quinone reductase